MSQTVGEVLLELLTKKGSFDVRRGKWACRCGAEKWCDLPGPGRIPYINCDGCGKRMKLVTTFIASGVIQ